MRKIILILVIFLFTGGCSLSNPWSSSSDYNTKVISNDSGIVYLGFMVHVEGWEKEVEEQDSFTAHREAVKSLADLFAAQGAKITFEFKPEFIQAAHKWQDSIIKDLIAQGHGIGVHADVGGNPREDLNLEKFISEIKDMKEKLEIESGQEVLHVSGICSDKDWVQAAISAGYKFTTGTVGYCAMSLPPDKRPTEYKECANPAACHGVIPTDLDGRFHPWSARTATNWLESDPFGNLVILSADYGLKSMAEEESGQDIMGSDAVFDQDDLEVYLSHLNQAIIAADPNQVTFLYPSLSLGSAQLDLDMYQQWLEQVQPSIDSGQAEWKTLPEIYQAYIQ